MPKPTWTGTEWTADDDAILREEIAAGSGWQYRAADRLGRSACACYQRARREELFAPRPWTRHARKGR